MKKSKLISLFIVLILSISVMIVGVYAINTLLLSPSGKISFMANETHVKLNTSITGAMRSNGTQVTNVNYGDYSDSFTTGENYLTDTTWNFGNIYFDEKNIPSNSSIQDIHIIFEIYNYSIFPITAIFDSVNTINNTVLTQTPNYYIEEYNETTSTPGYGIAEIIIKITSFDSFIALSKLDFSLSFNFTRNDIPVETVVDYDEAYTNGGYWGLVNSDNTTFTLKSLPKANYGSFITIPTYVVKDYRTYKVTHLDDFYVDNTDDGFASDPYANMNNMDCYSEIIIPSHVTHISDLTFGFGYYEQTIHIMGNTQLSSQMFIEGTTNIILKLDNQNTINRLELSMLDTGLFETSYISKIYINIECSMPSEILTEYSLNTSDSQIDGYKLYTL